MTNKGKYKNQQSVCEKSMAIFVNVIKVSSLSLANMSLRSLEPPPRPSGSDASIESFVIGGAGGGSGGSQTQKVQEHHHESKPLSYLKEPELGLRSQLFINAFHRRNKLDPSTTEDISNSIHPPPPPLREDVFYAPPHRDGEPSFKVSGSHSDKAIYRKR